MRKALVKRGDQIVEVMVDENTFKKGGAHGGLDRWFAEEWVDIKTGKPCGRQEGENRKGYPACRPSKRVSSDTPKTASELSSSEKEKFKRSKQSSSRIPYQHKRKEDGGESNNAEIMNMNFNYQDFFNNLGIPELKSGGNKPTNPSLWSRAKSLARSKFDVYPSAYANGWAAKWYKGKGGGWRKAQMGGEESDQMEEILDQIEDALEQGSQPEEILQQLVQMGIEQEQAQMLIQEAIQDLQEDATENELPEAQIGGQGQWMQDPSGQYSLDEELRTKVFPAALATIAAGAIPMYFKRRKEKRQEREEQERLEKENEETPTKAFGGNTDMFGDGGSYRVYKTSERKGKTHKVVGPGGVTKYFGDPKLGERSKSKYGKKGFYARHKKNLAKNPFFRAYARATWAEGGEPSFMQTPEFKTNSFVDLVRQEAESNVYKNIMNQAQEMFMQMGGAQDYGYVGNPYADMYQQNLDDLQAKGNVENAFFNGLNQIGLAAEKGIKTAANIIAPGSGAIVGMAMDAQRPKSLTDPTSKGMSTEGMASMLKGVISDPEALTGFFAKKGGSLRKFQDAGSFDPWSNWGLNQNNIILPQQPQQYNIADQSLNTPALDQINYFDEQGNYTNFEGPLNQVKQPEITTKDPFPNPDSKKPKPQISGLGFDPLLTGASILTAMGNRGKAKKAEAEMADMTAGDNVFAAAETLNRGDFDRNTGKLMKPYTLGTDEGIPALARYGGGLRRAKQGGVQKEGVYMSYPTATPESVLYGEQPKKPSNTLQPVKREFANLEAEDGETVIIRARDGLPKFFKIGGERHSNGGTPLNLPDGSFIFSDTKSMKLGGDILKELGIKGKKKRTPAKISKMLGIGKDYEKFIMIIQDPNSDKIERRTAELMIENQIKKLGMLALAQEAKKGFPEGIPMIAVPYMESVGIAPEQVLPQPKMGMEEMGMQQQMPMARYGMQKYQMAGQTDAIGMNPNAPFPVSSPTTPGERNVAQYILGNLENYFTSTPKEEAPIETNIQPVEVISPVKGFRSIEDLDEFIAKGDEFGQDFNALYNDYSQTIQTIDQLRTGLIEGWLPLNEYEKAKEGINSRINEIKTEIDESQKQIPWYKSWKLNQTSTADKLNDLSQILDQEKSKLNFRSKDLKKFRNLQNNLSFLETEKQTIVELLNSDIDNLVRMRLKRRLTDVNDALNYETDRTNAFGNRAFKKDYNYEEVDIEMDYSDTPVRNKQGQLYVKPETLLAESLPVGSGIVARKFTYDDYFKQYGNNPLTSNVKPSVETQKGSLNATEEVIPAVQDTVPVVEPSTPKPTQSKPKSSEKQVQKKPSLNIKVVSEEDKQYF